MSEHVSSFINRWVMTSIVTSHRWFVKAPLIAALLAAMTACTTDHDEPIAEVFSETGSQLRGRIAHLSVVSSDNLGRPEGVVSIAAQFVDYRGLETHSVRESLDLWSPAPDISVGSCQLTRIGSTAGIRDWTRGSIDLLHAADIEVTAGGELRNLEPRQMPYFLPYLRGYTYGTEAEQHPNYRPGMEISFWSGGGDDVGLFEVFVDMPEPIVVTYVGGVAVGSASMLDVDLFSDLLVLWTPNGSDDLIYLTVVEDGFGARNSLSCVAYDNGGFTVPTEALSRLEASSTPLGLTIRRANAESFVLAGFDQAEAVASTEHHIVVY